MMADTPNKPGDDAKRKQAVRNQGATKPEDYPRDDGGRPDYGSPDRHDGAA